MSADDQGTNSIKLLANVSLPMLGDVLPPAMSNDQTLRVEGTNVVRVPFGVRRPRRERPARPERWATVVLPFVAGGSTPPPPQAA
jgi:hypothetical protein